MQRFRSAEGWVVKDFMKYLSIALKQPQQDIFTEPLETNSGLHLN